MKTALKLMRQSVDDCDVYFKHDIEFHTAIGAATKNSIVLDLIKKMQKVSFDTRHTLWGNR